MRTSCASKQWLGAFAVRILGEAVETLEASAQGEPSNQRRVVLIHKSATTLHSTAEEMELDALPGTLERRIESMTE